MKYDKNSLPIKYIALIVTVSCLVLCVTGCSLIGLTAGMDYILLDDRERSETSREQLNYDSGTPLEITLTNNNRMKGQFVQIDTFSNTDYSYRLDRYKSEFQIQTPLPAMSDSISFNEDKTYRYIFKGFDHKAIRVKSTMLNTSSDINLDSISIINVKGGVVSDPYIIQKLMSEHKLPYYWKMVISHKGQQTELSGDVISKIKNVAPQFQPMFGLLFGLVIDLYLVDSLPGVNSGG